MSDNIRPYQFISFDQDESSKSEDPLIKFNLKRKKFIPSFKTDTKYEFKELFSEKGELTKEDYKKGIEEYYNKKKKEAEEEIKKYIEEKKVEANKIIEEAIKQSDEIKAKAYNEGFEKGYNEGVQKGENEIKNKILELENLLKNLKDFEKKAIIENYTFIGKLIIHFAKKVIKKELEINKDEILIKNLKAIFEKIVDKSFIEIKINPQQYDFINSKLKELKEIYDLKELNLVKSNEISLGSCVVETNFGSYDARIEEQINELEKIVTNKI